MPVLWEWIRRARAVG